MQHGQPIHCRICRYQLNGLTSFRCPECGCTFDPNNPKTLYQIEENKPENAADWVMWIIGIVCLIVLLIVGLVGAMLW